MPKLNPQVAMLSPQYQSEYETSQATTTIPFRDYGGNRIRSQKAYRFWFHQGVRVANIVPIPKKNGKIRICIDFRDLNVTCPKDEFPLPITDVMIDNTCRFERMTFMDDFSGCNKIKMYPKDEKHTSFRASLEVYCCTVMPFGLKNTGATYQCAMNTIFKEHVRKTTECYVNDIAVKSCNKGNHLSDLKKVFDIVRVHQLKINPTKSFLRVASGKFLGFVVSSKGIHLDLEKIHVIQEMQFPRNLK